MTVSRKLRTKHNYKHYADTCRNCKHFKTDASYGGVDGMFADTCHVDADFDNPDQDVYILHKPWGVCDEHERVRIKTNGE